VELRGCLTQRKSKDSNEGLEAYKEERPDEGDIFGAVRRRNGVSDRESSQCRRCMLYAVSHHSQVEAPEERDRHLGRFPRDSTSSSGTVILWDCDMEFVYPSRAGSNKMHRGQFGKLPRRQQLEWYPCGREARLGWWAAGCGGDCLRMLKPTLVTSHVTCQSRCQTRVGCCGQARPGDKRAFFY
jgi:hypothetical protein